MSRFYYSLNELRTTENTLSTVAARIDTYLKNIRSNNPNIIFTNDELDILNWCSIDYEYIGGQGDLWANNINNLSEKTSLEEETKIFQNVKATLIQPSYIERANACARIAINYTKILNIFDKIPEHPEKTEIQRELIAPVQRLTRLPLIANEWDTIIKKNADDYSATPLANTVRSIKAKFFNMALKLNTLVNPPLEDSSIMSQFVRTFLTLLHKNHLSTKVDEHQKALMNSTLLNSITKTATADAQINEQESTSIDEMQDGIQEPNEDLINGLQNIYFDSITSGLFHSSVSIISPPNYIPKIPKEATYSSSTINLDMHQANLVVEDMGTINLPKSNGDNEYEESQILVHHTLVQTEERIKPTMLQDNYQEEAENNTVVTDETKLQDSNEWMTRARIFEPGEFTNLQEKPEDIGTNLVESNNGLQISATMPTDMPPSLPESTIPIQNSNEKSKNSGLTESQMDKITQLPLAMDNPQFGNDQKLNNNIEHPQSGSEAKNSLEVSATMPKDLPPTYPPIDPTDLTLSKMNDIEKLPLAMDNSQFDYDNEFEYSQSDSEAEKEPNVPLQSSESKIKDFHSSNPGLLPPNQPVANVRADSSKSVEEVVNKAFNIKEAMSLVVQALVAAIILAFLSAWIAASILSSGALPVIVIAAAGIGAAVGFAGVGLYHLIKNDSNTGALLSTIGLTGMGASIGTILGTLVFPGVGTGIGAAIGAGIGFTSTAILIAIEKTINYFTNKPTIQLVNELDVDVKPTESNVVNHNQEAYTGPDRLFKNGESFDSQKAIINSGMLMKK